MMLFFFYLSIISLGIGDSYLNPFQEESPSCCKTVFHLTNGRSNARESATEIRLPHYVVMVKRWCKRPPVFMAT